MEPIGSQQSYIAKLEELLDKSISELEETTELLVARLGRIMIPEPTISSAKNEGAVPVQHSAHGLYLDQMISRITKTSDKLQETIRRVEL